MKRIKTVKVNNEYAVIQITISVQGKELTRDEVDRLVNNLTDQTMLGVQRAPWMNGTLHRMKVRP